MPLWAARCGASDRAACRVWTATLEDRQVAALLVRYLLTDEDLRKLIPLRVEVSEVLLLLEQPRRVPPLSGLAGYVEHEASCLTGEAGTDCVA